MHLEQNSMDRHANSVYSAWGKACSRDPGIHLSDPYCWLLAPIGIFLYSTSSPYSIDWYAAKDPDKVDIESASSLRPKGENTGVQQMLEC